MQQDPKPKVLYRFQSQKSFDINSDHSDVRARARQLVVLRSALFGKKRYQSIILHSSLYNFFNSLRVAQVLHAKVPDLSMIIRFIEFNIVECFEDGTSHTIKRKRVEIKLTRNPTEEDKAEAGFNQGFAKEKIVGPIEDVVPRREGRGGGNRYGGRRWGPRRENAGREYGGRGEQRGYHDNRVDNRNHRNERNENRVENRTENRAENRNNNRNETRQDNRQGNRNEPKNNDKYDNNYRKRKQYEELSDEEEEYKREGDRREGDRKDRDNNDRTRRKVTRGGGKGNYDRGGERERDQHNYDPSHLNRK